MARRVKMFEYSEQGQAFIFQPKEYRKSGGLSIDKSFTNETRNGGRVTRKKRVK